MNNVKPTNVSSSAATSKKPQPNRAPAKPASERQFLARQVGDAKLAMSQSATDAARSLGTAVDPRAWTREHPIIATGLAAAAGFFAARVITPGKNETLHEKWDELTERLAALTDRAKEKLHDKADESESNGRPRHQTQHGWTRLLHPLGETLKSALTSSITALIASQLNRGEQPDSQPADQVSEAQQRLIAR